MSTDKSTDNTVTMTQADLDSALAQAKADGKEEGLKAGIEQEQSRVDAILKLDSAKGMINATLAAAIENGLQASAAEKFLAAAPVQKSNSFVAAMDAIGNPSIDADGGNDSTLTDDQLAARAVSLIQS